MMDEFETQTTLGGPPTPGEPVTALDTQGLIVRLGAGAFTFHSTTSDSQGRPVGAVFAAEHTCKDCGRGFGPNQVIVAVFLPHLGGRFYHSNCDDPELLAETEQL